MRAILGYMGADPWTTVQGPYAFPVQGPKMVNWIDLLGDLRGTKGAYRAGTDDYGFAPVRSPCVGWRAGLFSAPITVLPTKG